MPLKKTFVKSKNCYKVTFELAAEENPNKEVVRLLGDFNNWSADEAPVLKLKNGSYKTSLELPVDVEYQYRYKIGEHDWANDAVADAYVSSPHAYVDNCLVQLSSPSVTTGKKIENSKVNFAKIEGIGPKISSLLHEAGVTSYKELGAMKKKDIASILSLAGKRYAMHDPSTWAKQSKLLAQGKIQELKALQAELKGGKKKK